MEVVDGETLEMIGRIVPAEPRFHKGGYVEIGVSPAEDQMVASKQDGYGYSSFHSFVR